MELIKKIQEQLDLGFTKKDLEILISLPANNLAGFMNGRKRFSKKNQIRIERWLAREDKPDPLEFAIVKAKIANNKLSGIYISREELNDIGENIKQYPLTIDQCFKDLTKPTHQIKEIKATESNSVIDTRPVKASGENSIDFKIRLGDWEEKNSKK